MRLKNGARPHDFGQECGALQSYPGFEVVKVRCQPRSHLAAEACHTAPIRHQECHPATLALPKHDGEQPVRSDSCKSDNQAFALACHDRSLLRQFLGRTLRTVEPTPSQQTTRSPGNCLNSTQ